jgi:hypothetical protein
LDLSTVTIVETRYVAAEGKLVVEAGPAPLFGSRDTLPRTQMRLASQRKC